MGRHGETDVSDTQRPPIEPIEPAFTRTYHSAAQLDRLKQATLDILETVGVRIRSSRALDILEEAGAAIDRATEVVKLPPDLVLEAMDRAPRRFVLGARDASCDIAVGDGRTYCTTDGCGVEVVDFRTRERRPSTKADLADITRLQDALSSISFWWPTVSAGDCGETAQLHELDAGWNNTVKHLQGMVNGGREARYAVEMATVIAGGAEELRRSIARKECYCTTEVFLWPSIVFQPPSLAKAMLSADAWRKPQPLPPDEIAPVALDEARMPITPGQPVQPAAPQAAAAQVAGGSGTNIALDLGVDE